ncbi:DUF1684 domain-containing protein [Algoriphagus sp. CAU 1675]|uniref:DUF1684 domain-containing protein n=1 Tax=Algoriphagus sp. CAU 1675 TaxID=3032597 RepID=UPI0023DAF9B3|nr:DUF1684 domain-containing protein [Algoriphagus sp. CAU 1675]MDF2159073.1 DUF1684 domain-containing protein [Algoriphagus sp. CAU 1675]
MKTNSILIIFVSVVVLAAVLYTLTGTDNPEVYQEKIEAERERQFKFIRFSADSPLSEEQKKSFSQLNFYPIDPAYKVKARLLPVENQKIREVPMTDGTKERYIEHAFAEFELGGKTNRLLLLQSVDESDKKNFFLAFADETSSRDTYGGGRFLNVRQDGKNSITLDFNLAYNPYCAYNPDYACPLPPRENLLTIPVEAGEKNYGK